MSTLDFVVPRKYEVIASIYECERDNSLQASLIPYYLGVDLYGRDDYDYYSHH